MKKLITILGLCLALYLQFGGIIFRPHKHLKPQDFYTTGLVERSDGFYGSCVVIHDGQWILTAAHMVDNPDAFYTVSLPYLDSHDFIIDTIYRHPFEDIALCHLNRPAPRCAPISFTKLLVGQRFYGAGYGRSSIDPDPNFILFNRNDQNLRIISNKIEHLTNDVENLIVLNDCPHTADYDIDCPESLFSVEGEGIVGPGDSGGGIYIYQGRKPYLVGITVSFFYSNRGLNGCFVYLSAYQDWINEVLPPLKEQNYD